ncbi:MAG: HD domain-containing protein [Sideroxydans sp.]|nr:HD domain-containing protein [Sideroxydans sp.]
MELKNDSFNALYTYTKALSVALRFRDELTRLHSERVRNLAAAVGLRCNLNDSELEELKIAASFHDIGKIGIPDSILLKPGSFNDAEWAVMKTHAVIGEKIIASTELEGSLKASKLIRHHHERFDGGGYPDGLKGERIPLCARIITLTDSYDAMAMTRKYHTAKSHAEVMDVLRQETGRKHDPELMAIFGEVIESSPLKAA